MLQKMDKWLKFDTIEPSHNNFNLKIFKSWHCQMPTLAIKNPNKSSRLRMSNFEP